MHSNMTAENYDQTIFGHDSSQFEQTQAEQVIKDFYADDSEKTKLAMGLSQIKREYRRNVRELYQNGKDDTFCQLSDQVDQLKNTGTPEQLADLHRKLFHEYTQITQEIPVARDSYKESVELDQDDPELINEAREQYNALYHKALAYQSLIREVEQYASIQNIDLSASDSTATSETKTDAPVAKPDAKSPTPSDTTDSSTTPENTTHPPEEQATDRTSPPEKNAGSPETIARDIESIASDLDQKISNHYFTMEYQQVEGQWQYVLKNAESLDRTQLATSLQEQMSNIMQAVVEANQRRAQFKLNREAKDNNLVENADRKLSGVIDKALAAYFDHASILDNISVAVHDGKISLKKSSQTLFDMHTIFDYNKRTAEYANEDEVGIGFKTEAELQAARQKDNEKIQEINTNITYIEEKIRSKIGDENFAHIGDDVALEKIINHYPEVQNDIEYFIEDS